MIPPVSSCYRGRERAWLDSVSMACVRSSQSEWERWERWERIETQIWGENGKWNLSISFAATCGGELLHILVRSRRLFYFWFCPTWSIRWLNSRKLTQIICEVELESATCHLWRLYITRRPFYFLFRNNYSISFSLTLPSEMKIWCGPSL